MVVVVVVGERAGAGASCVLMRRGGGTRVEICAIARNRDVLLRTSEIYTTSPYVTASGECMSISRGYSLCRRMVPRSEIVRAQARPAHGGLRALMQVPMGRRSLRRMCSHRRGSMAGTRRLVHTLWEEEAGVIEGVVAVSVEKYVVDLTVTSLMWPAAM